MSWYYAEGRQQQGPIDDSAIQVLIAAGRLKPDTLVWRPGQSEWLRAGAIQGMFSPPTSGSLHAVGTPNILPARQAALRPPLPPSKLFSPGQIRWATFFGSPLAGSFLLAKNYRQLGFSMAFWLSLAGGCAATVLLMVISAFIADHHSSSVALPVVSTLIMGALASALQGKTFEAHIAAGGAKHSNWRVTGIILACTGLVILLILFVVVLGASNSLTSPAP